MDPADTSAGEMITLFEYFARLAAKSSANQSSHHQPARAGSMQVASCRPKVQQPSYQPTPQPAPQSLRLGIVRLQPACSERVSQPSTHQVPVCSPQACPGPQQALVKQWSSQDHVQQSRYVGTRLAIFTGNRGASKRRRGSHGTRQHWQSHQCSSTLSPQPRSSESSLPSLPEPLLPSHSEPLLPSAPESESPLPDSPVYQPAAQPTPVSLSLLEDLPASVFQLEDLLTTILQLEALPTSVSRSEVLLAPIPAPHSAPRLPPIPALRSAPRLAPVPAPCSAPRQAPVPAPRSTPVPAHRATQAPGSLLAAQLIPVPRFMFLAPADPSSWLSCLLFAGLHSGRPVIRLQPLTLTLSSSPASPEGLRM